MEQVKDTQYVKEEVKLNLLNWPWSFNVGSNSGGKEMWQQYDELDCCMIECFYKKLRYGKKGYK